LTVYGTCELYFCLDSVAFSTKINGRGSLDITGDDALNVYLPAKKATPMSACGQLVVKRRKAAWHLLVELLHERVCAKTQCGGNSRLGDESRVLIGSEWGLCDREGRIDHRHPGDYANDTKTAA
jgi:hypothetical protein